MKHLASLALVAISTISLAGEFREVREGLWHYTGTIVHSDVAKFKKILADNSHINLVIVSPGGSMDASIELGNMTRMNNSKIQITVKECFSGAAMWALADKDYRYFDKDSFIANHYFWYESGYSPTEADWIHGGGVMGVYFYKMLGEKWLTLWNSLRSMRDAHGTRGWVVDTKSGVRKTGTWDWDKDNWSFSDPTAKRPSARPIYRRPSQ